MLILSSTDITNVNFFKNLFQGQSQSGKWFESRYGSKLFAKVISRPQNIKLDHDPNFLTKMVSLNLFFCKI